MSVAQSLAVLPIPFLIEHLPDASRPEDDEWTALMRAPGGGLTVVKEAPHDARNDHWIGLYSGETAHDLEATGMLAALVDPLAEAGISVFAASTYHADLLLVPEPRLDDAVTALEAAGHTVRR
ncbi:ACT domain-containing protein [Actinomadura algeriensis]|uniref:CASTOR ACT domain-containing protein n=1 Tax=Actinomadura algeriensis TaxID=1679523 RepID=A0ABR9JQ74_9ACTN|nr:ACT domain-containing protein [Actinomadura algeriensis]MBE1532701.1 hypothetical protein [Actinomadura algeriensis]